MDFNKLNNKNSIINSIKDELSKINHFNLASPNNEVEKFESAYQKFLKFDVHLNQLNSSCIFLQF